MIRAKRFIAAMLATLTLLLSIALPVSAAEYNCGAYGASSYQTGTCATTTTGQPSTGNTLENTGEKLLPIIIPALLILTGTIGLFVARRKRGQATTSLPEDRGAGLRH